ncbi:hypothetical protein, partial [Vibrio hepatarius]|uniref:hypothetical protein n=1 Tax=Vibrio hepatarius TaxID=171383 RepID=UPI002FD96440
MAILVGCSANPSQGKISPANMDKDTLSLFVEDNTLYLSGVLASQLPSQLKSVLTEHPNVTDVVLVDVPGSTDQLAVMEAARMLRYLEMKTH